MAESTQLAGATRTSLPATYRANDPRRPIANAEAKPSLALAQNFSITSTVQQCTQALSVSAAV